MWLIDGFSGALSLWWYENRHIWRGRERRLIEREPPIWSQTENAGIEEEYFKLWKNLNGLYEPLSILWKVLGLTDQLNTPYVHAMVAELYCNTQQGWVNRRDSIRSLDRLPIEEQIAGYRQMIHASGMKLDYSRLEVRITEGVGKNI